MDTITLIRSALRGLLKVADPDLEAELRAVLSGGDDYAGTGKPQIDWDDPGAREELIASRARDGYAVLAVVDGRELDERVEQAAALLATVLGQDLETGEDGVFRIARRVAKDRVISTVDPDARHGHKTASRGFDGYKGHAAMDPDSEIITATTVTPGNIGDAAAAEDLIADLLPDTPEQAEDEQAPRTSRRSGPRTSRRSGPRARPRRWSTAMPRMARVSSTNCSVRRGSSPAARPRRRPRQVGCSARTGSTSTCRPVVRPARPGSPHRSGSPVAATAAASPTSGRAAPAARCARSAPRRREGPLGQHRPARAGPRRRPSPPSRPRMGRRLPRDPPQGRAQARAPDAAQTPA